MGWAAGRWEPNRVQEGLGMDRDGNRYAVRSGVVSPGGENQAVRRGCPSSRKHGDKRGLVRPFTKYTPRTPKLCFPAPCSVCQDSRGHRRNPTPNSNGVSAQERHRARLHVRAAHQLPRHPPPPSRQEFLFSGTRAEGPQITTGEGTLHVGSYTRTRTVWPLHMLTPAL